MMEKKILKKEEKRQILTSAPDINTKEVAIDFNDLSTNSEINNY